MSILTSKIRLFSNEHPQSLVSQGFAGTLVKYVTLRRKYTNKGRLSASFYVISFKKPIPSTALRLYSMDEWTYSRKVVRTSL